MDIGKQIARLRREQQLTQEQLGLAIGVSAQAVSKWENGGAPDAELLPAIADRLGVSIDTLFGREEKHTEPMELRLLRHLGTLPPEARLYELFRILCSTFARPYCVDNEFLDAIMESMPRVPIKSCYSTDFIHHRSERLWLRSALLMEEGMSLGVLSEDCPLILLLPEPEGGYEANLADDERYRALFAALALPGALELLRCLYRRERGYVSPDAVARLAGLEPDCTRRAMEALCACKVLEKTQVEQEAGPQAVYRLHDMHAFVPLLLFARWLMEEDYYFNCWYERRSPLLRRKEASHES